MLLRQHFDLFLFEFPFNSGKFDNKTNSAVPLFNDEQLAIILLLIGCSSSHTSSSLNDFLNQCLKICIARNQPELMAVLYKIFEHSQLIGKPNLVHF